MEAPTKTTALRAIDRMVSEQFDKPLIENNIRGTYVEYLVAELLGDEWSVSTNWDSWDLNGPNGERLEVKSSSFIQSWHTEEEIRKWKKLPYPAFDIRGRLKRWEPELNEWIDEAGRAAQIYVFAMHEETDFARADHRDIEQWAFYVAPAEALPAQKRISLGRVKSLFDRVDAGFLKSAVKAKLNLETI